jgi:benzodiazapine receptor
VLTLSMNKIVSLAVFLFCVIGGGVLIGMLTVPGAWHAGLIKPSFNPPNWIFGPVWTILYTFIAIAGWRTWQKDRSGLAMKAWWMQLLLNFLWSPLFFVAHRIDGAFVVIGLLLVTIITFIASGWHRDRIAALLFVPYAAWVAFASALNGAILYLN